MDIFSLGEWTGALTILNLKRSIYCIFFWLDYLETKKRQRWIVDPHLVERVSKTRLCVAVTSSGLFMFDIFALHLLLGTGT